MAHDKFVENISQWLDNELGPAEIAELRQHLAECPACRHVYQTMRQVDAMFQAAAAVMVEPGTEFSAAVEARLARTASAKTGHLWLGLGSLLAGALFFFTIGAILGGITLAGTVPALFDLTILYHGLGLAGEMVNHIRALLNLGGLFLKVALLTMSQPLFWGYVLTALGLAWLWVRMMRAVYQREPVTVDMIF